MVSAFPSRPHRVRSSYKPDRQVVKTRTRCSRSGTVAAVDRARPDGARAEPGAPRPAAAARARAAPVAARARADRRRSRTSTPRTAYIRLWSCIEGFRARRPDAGLERRSVVQGTLMRETIHLVARRDYPLFASAIRRSRPRVAPARSTSARTTASSRAARERLRSAPARPHDARAGARRRSSRRRSRAPGEPRPRPAVRAHGSSAARTRSRSPKTGSARSSTARTTAIEHLVAPLPRAFGPAAAGRRRELTGSRRRASRPCSSG